VEQPSIKGLRRNGLRALSPDLIEKARDDTATQVSRIGLTFVGTAAFCLLSLLSPDSALLGSSSEKVSLPFAGPVSFFGFILLGPAVLIVLRIYLQIYVEHSERLDRIAKRLPVGRAPTLVPLKNPLVRAFAGFAFYVLLPLVMLLFAWKAAVFPAWGSGLLCVAVAVIAIHLMLPLYRFSWRSKTFLGMGAAILALGVMAVLGTPHRPFNLFRASLSGAYLRGANLSRADLRDANLSRANLSRVNLRDASLSGSDLSGADLSGADLSRANLSRANLSGADLSDLADLSYASLEDANLSGADLSLVNLRDANLRRANLSRADLNSVRNLVQEELDAACGTDTKLPLGLTLNKPCSSK
jgi:uncharacterized protein YjbI with pentapeptide repeats